MKIIDKKQDVKENTNIIEIPETMEFDHPTDPSKTIVLEKGEKVQVLDLADDKTVGESKIKRPDAIDEYQEGKKKNEQEDDDDMEKEDDEMEGEAPEADEKKKKESEDKSANSEDNTQTFEIVEEVEFINGDQKVILEKGDKITVACSEEKN